MTRLKLGISSEAFDKLRQHLLPTGAECEEAAFLFTRTRQVGDELLLEVIETQTIAPEGFVVRSPFYLELTDELRAAIIKRAHDLGAGLVECHSHPGQRIACFSWSDLHGFDDFVPHVLWRLKGRPYAAIVLARDSFDGLVWTGAGKPARPLDEVVTDRGVCDPTGHTFTRWSEIYDRRPL